VAGYDFEALGWLLFQRLATDAAQRELGIDPAAWDGAADERREARDDRRTVRMAWVRGTDAAARRARLAAVAEGEHVTVLTNAHEAEATAAGPARILGAAWLTDVLDRTPQLRLTHPAVLAGGDLARVFVPVGAYHAALAVLERHGFAVLVGPPEMGKTAIARMIAQALATDGWETHECLTPEAVWGAWRPEARQVFVADDAFGSTEYRPDAAERWGRDMERLLRSLDATHWLIWTSRTAPLHAGLARLHRERGAERFPRPLDVLVDAAALDRAEKAMILLRHAKAAGASGTSAAPLVRAHADAIVEHPHVTPERIRRLATSRLFRLDPDPARGLEVAALLVEELHTPTVAMSASFAALDDAHRAVLVALLDCPPGAVPERDLAAAVRRHAPGGLPRAPAELTDRLADHFLRVTGASVTWVHPSWRDLVIDHLAADRAARAAFLAHAELDGILLALSVAGGQAGERTLPLLVEDDDWDLVTVRAGHVARHGDDHDTLRLLRAVEAARRAQGGPSRAEIDALAAGVLRALRRRWDAAPEPPSVVGLAAWFDLAAVTDEAVEPPKVARTWFAVLPPAEGPLDDDGLRAADEWLWLIEVLWYRRRSLLLPLGSEPNEVRVELVREAIEAGADPGDTARAALLETLRARLGRLPGRQPAPVEMPYAFQFDAPMALPDPGPSAPSTVDRILRDL